MKRKKLRDDRALALALSLFALVLFTYIITLAVAYIMVRR